MVNKKLNNYQARFDLIIFHRQKGKVSLKRILVRLKIIFFNAFNALIVYILPQKRLRIIN